MKKNKLQQTYGFRTAIATQSLYGTWQSHINDLDDLIEQSGPECKERFEFRFKEHRNYHRLIAFRNSSGNIVGTLECRLIDRSKKREVTLFLHPNYWATGLANRLLAHGNKIWHLNREKDILYFFGW